jgi:hypothetical protein
LVRTGRPSQLRRRPRHPWRGSLRLRHDGRRGANYCRPEPRSQDRRVPRRPQRRSDKGEDRFQPQAPPLRKRYRPPTGQAPSSVSPKRVSDKRRDQREHGEPGENCDHQIQSGGGWNSPAETAGGPPSAHGVNALRIDDRSVEIVGKTPVRKVGSKASKARGRNRITGNLSVQSRPLAPPQHHPRIAIAGDIPPGSCKSSGRQIDYTEAGAASTCRGMRVCAGRCLSAPVAQCGNVPSSLNEFRQRYARAREAHASGISLVPRARARGPP